MYLKFYWTIGYILILEFFFWSITDIYSFGSILSHFHHFIPPLLQATIFQLKHCSQKIDSKKLKNRFDSDNNYQITLNYNKIPFISINTLYVVFQLIRCLPYDNGLMLAFVSCLFDFLLFLCISNWVIFHKRPIKITNSSNLSYFIYHFVELFFYIRKCEERSKQCENILRQIKHIQLQYLVNHSPPGLTFDRSHICRLGRVQCRRLSFWMTADALLF